MSEITLPSGQKMLSVRNVSTSSGNVSTSGAMSLETPGTCPKCSKVMGHALVGTEKVFYCTSCRVSLPLPL
jgi:hypothetical protein